MGKRAPAMLLLVTLVLSAVGCTRLVDPPQAHPGIPVAPLTAGQAPDLLSPDIDEQDGNLFVTVEPQRCAGIAQEVDPPFIFDDNPAAHDGGHWIAPGDPEVYIEEMVGVYRANFDSRAALAAARETVESCRDTPFVVTSMSGRSYEFSLRPAPDSGSPEILLWSFAAADWACDSALVAAHNAAIEISTCAETGGYDVLSLAEKALGRIEALANTVA